MKIKTNSIIRGIILVVILLLFLILNQAPQILTKYFLINILIINIFSLFVFSLRTETNKYLKNQYLKILYLFLVGFIIVHFQIYVEYSLDNYKFFGRDYFLDESLVSKAILISSIALNTFLIGYLSYKNNNIRINKSNIIYHPTQIILFFNFVLFIFFLITNDTSYYSGGYGEGGEVLSGFPGFFQQFYVFSIISYVTVITRNSIVCQTKVNNIISFISLFNKFFLLFVTIFLFLILLSGDRGPIIQIGIVFLASFLIITKRKLNLIVILLFLIVSSSFFSFIGYYRTFKETNSIVNKIELAVEAKKVSGKSKAFSPNTLELAGSVTTFHAALIYTENGSYTYGIFQGYQLLSIVPGFRFLFKNITGIDGDNVVSTKFLTILIQGDNITHGSGTTAIADVYLDFGLIGTIIIFFVFGYFLRKLEFKIFSDIIPSVLNLTFFFVFISKAVYIGRSQIVFVLKEAIIVYLIIVILFYLSKLFTNPKINF